MKSTNAVKEFLDLREGIMAEREKVLARLREIDEAIGAKSIGSYAAPKRTKTLYRNKATLKETVLKVLRGKSLTKEEILAAVLATGYRFSTDDPANSLGVILYGKGPKFKREGEKFRLE